MEKEMKHEMRTTELRYGGIIGWGSGQSGKLAKGLADWKPAQGGLAPGKMNKKDAVATKESIQAMIAASTPHDINPMPNKLRKRLTRGEQASWKVDGTFRLKINDRWWIGYTPTKNGFKDVQVLQF